jgi:hypothetical protein
MCRASFYYPEFTCRFSFGGAAQAKYVCEREMKRE